jgi:uncharacterized membrane protein YphA (DoxX/SURF4 family)
MAPFVGTVEIVCGFLVLVGLATRYAAVPLLGVIGVALISTKISMLSKNGFWATSHEARADLCMLLGLLFLIFVGGGSLALDEWVASKRQHNHG